MGLAYFFTETKAGKKIGRAIADAIVARIRRKEEKLIKPEGLESFEERLSDLEAEVQTLRDQGDFLEELLEDRKRPELPSAKPQS